MRRRNLRRAVATAREILRGTVCQCGDATSEHAIVKLAPRNPLKVIYGRCNVRGCGCRQFTPVRFAVEVRA